MPTADEMPVYGAPPATSANKADGPSTEGAQRRVLVIEDHQNIANLVKLHVQDLGCDVTLAFDGNTGLGEAEAKAYDLVILDLMLPGIDGLEICRRLRPLQRLTEAVDRFRGDDFSDESRLQAVPSASSRDEIGRLADTFKEMAARIVKQVRELKQNDTARRELFANISHDLRTPLASLLGYLETVAIKENLSEEERRKYCQIAIQEARHLTALVDNLLELAKLDAPEAASAREPFMLQELSQAVIRKFALAASEKGVTLAQHFPHAMPMVWADPALIERVLENLVDNALHHTPAGGTVSIDLVPDVKGVTVRVSDSGSGIAPENLPRIFDRFYRGEKSRQVAANSAGLGLAITKRILELHDCSITVESYVGLGTRFSFTLPIADASKAPAAALLGRDVGLRRGPEPLSTAVAEPGGQRP